MVFQPFSPEIEQIFDITGTTVLYMFRPRLPHPQAGMMKFALRGYKDETLDHLDHVVLVTCILLGAFSKAELEKLAKVQSAHVDVYWKKAWGGLTDKEREEEKKLMKEQRRANYRKSANSFCDKDPGACLTHAQKKDPKKTLEDLSCDDKASYMQSVRFENAKANGKGAGAWRAASEEERKEKGWEDNQTRSHNISLGNRKGLVYKKPSGSYVSVLHSRLYLIVHMPNTSHIIFRRPEWIIKLLERTKRKRLRK